jgi:hemerythrin
MKEIRARVEPFYMAPRMRLLLVGRCRKDLEYSVHTFDHHGTSLFPFAEKGGPMRDTLHSEPVKIGERTIDAEHDLQMQLLDALSQAIAKGGDFAPTRHILEQFIEFSDMHFLSEQLIMRLNAYPGYEAHLEEHTRLMKKLRDVRESIVHNENVSTLQLLLELRDWLLNHIATDDAAFGEFLTKKEAQPLS